MTKKEKKLWKCLTNVKYSVAATNGTSSLLACLAPLGIGAGDEVIVPGYTFIASISSIMIAGAIPVLAERFCEKIGVDLSLTPADTFITTWAGS